MNILNYFANKREFKKFYKAWRERNLHNRTTPGRIFNPDKVKVGNYTYGTLNVLDFYYENEFLEIGHFCSIANGVKFILAGNHHMERFSTYPFNTFFGEGGPGEGYSKGAIKIGSDVWIGFDAWVMSGVSVGQGAVVAARSLVVKDVPPYAIVGGNPAKIIKYRFEPHVIKKLLQVDYSKLNEDFCKKNLFFLTSSMNLESFDHFTRRLAESDV